MTHFFEHRRVFNMGGPEAEHHQNAQETAKKELETGSKNFQKQAELLTKDLGKTEKGLTDLKKSFSAEKITPSPNHQVLTDKAQNEYTIKTFMVAAKGNPDALKQTFEKSEQNPAAAKAAMTKQLNKLFA
ncbi:MAG: hypothetical protein WCJ84_04710 [Candidatus Peregrinibacteria bacterium]